MKTPIQTLWEHLPEDYLGPDPDDQFSGEKYGVHPEAVDALRQLDHVWGVYEVAVRVRDCLPHPPSNMLLGELNTATWRAIIATDPEILTRIRETPSESTRREKLIAVVWLLIGLAVVAQSIAFLLGYGP